MAEPELPLKNVPDVAQLDDGTSDQAALASAKTTAEPAPADDDVGERLVGQDIGKYRICNLLGRGGMGTVYLGFDTVLEREVAIKILPSEVAARPNALSRFLSEARATGKLNHPHVVAIYDLGQSSGLYYFVMEVLRGGSVADLLERQGALPWRDACRLIAQAADGLAAAHAVGLVHRDLKPENLMFNADHVVKVVDFGVSKLVDESAAMQITAAGQLLGTPHYMSPEQVRGGELDARSDMYNLGGTLFRLLTGHYPYDGCKSVTQVLFAHLEQPPPVPSARDAAIPAECDAIIARAMAKNPAERYQTIGEMAQALRAAADGPEQGAGSAVKTARAATPVTGAARTLSTVAVVEPSRMQGMILQKAFEKAGVAQVRAFSSAASVREEFASKLPDLLLTAQQLPDGLGLDLVRHLLGQPGGEGLTALIASNDLSPEELFASSPAAGIGVVSKRIRAEEIFRGLHAATGYSFSSTALDSSRDERPGSVLVLGNSTRVPEKIATVLRSLPPLDVRYSPLSRFSDEAGEFDLLLALAADASISSRHAFSAQLAAQVAAHSRVSSRISAIAGVMDEELVLQFISMKGFAFATDCLLDSQRMLRLLEAAGMAMGH